MRPTRILDMDDFDFDDCYKSITERNGANFEASGEVASMEIAFLTYLCEKFSDDNIDIMLSVKEKYKVMGILKEMGIKNELERNTKP